jgi:putative transposase
MGRFKSLNRTHVLVPMLPHGVPLLACPAVHKIAHKPNMEQSLLHRKRVQHFNEPGHFHALTFSCYKRLPLLTNDAWLVMLSESIDRAMRHHRYLLNAFVYMPEHVHLLVFSQEAASGIDELLKAIKRPFSYRIKQLLAKAESPLLGLLTTRQRPGVIAFPFWQEGPGYDRNLLTLEAALAATAYIHLNPVRRGLVTNELDWQWSSSRHYSEAVVDPTRQLPRVCLLNDIPFA